MNLWNYRVVLYSSLCDDGDVYGMAEAYYVERGEEVILQAFSQDPYFIVQDVGDFPVKLDEFEAEVAAGIEPEWAEGIGMAELPEVLAMMRRALNEKTINERKILQQWGEA